MTEPTAEEQKIVNGLDDYVQALVKLIDDGDVGTADPGVVWDDQTDGTFHAWVDGWNAFYGNWKSGKWPIDPGVSLQTWRNSANAWWDLGRRSGEIVRPKDVSAGDGLELPTDDKPPKTTTPINTIPPKKDGGTKRTTDKTPLTPEPKKDAQDTRKTPWVALLLVAGPLLFLWARRRSHGA